MKFGLLMVLLVATSSCGTLQRDGLSDSASPRLTLADWKEIKQQFSERRDYRFSALIREASHPDALQVILKLRVNQYEGVILHFDRRSDHWIEDKARAETTAWLIP